MQPNSILLVVLLVIACLAALFLLRRAKHLAVGLVSGLLAFVLAATTGMAIVNDYYGYYQSWGQLSDDLTGSYASFTTPIATRAGTVTGKGQVRSVDLTGASSGINRRGLVYLPPQYFEKRYASTRFPVLELVHGTPGTPSDWIVHLRLLAVLRKLAEQRLAGPMVIVMPTMSVGHDFQECVDGPGGKDDTYITDDVRTDVEHSFRVSADPAEWGIAGYSSGGYCAANLALRHPELFGASGIMDGYFRPQDGPAAAALGHDPASEAANNPLALAAALPADVSPLPAFWMSAGTGDAADYAGAEAFARALHGVETVPLNRESGAGHNFYAWAGALPHLLAWTWQQLAPPNLRVRFPIAGSVNRSTIVAPVPLRRRPHTTPSGTPHATATPSSAGHANSTPRSAGHTSSTPSSTPRPRPTSTAEKTA